MDDRDQPDTNVIRLRRRGDPGEAERKRLASTIFAEEDDVGTFSRGNLVPPKQSAHRDEEPPVAPDPFFDELQKEPSMSSASAEAERLASESTAAYFDQIDSQTPDLTATNAHRAPASRFGCRQGRLRASSFAFHVGSAPERPSCDRLGSQRRSAAPSCSQRARASPRSSPRR